MKYVYAYLIDYRKFVEEKIDWTSTYSNLPFFYTGIFFW